MREQDHLGVPVAAQGRREQSPGPGGDHGFGIKEVRGREEERGGGRGRERGRGGGEGGSEGGRGGGGSGRGRGREVEEGGRGIDGKAVVGEKDV